MTARETAARELIAVPTTPTKLPWTDVPALSPRKLFYDDRAQSY
jgi:hypothetical protein